MLTKKRIILLLILAAVCILTPILSTCQKAAQAKELSDVQVLTLWQVDSFEGGRGSRSQYLQNAANALFYGRNCFIKVTSISADAARKNMAEGNIPDMLSYGAGFYGLGNYVNVREFAYKNWCRGGYCLLTLDDSADFGDVTRQNTVINIGKDNFAKACALLCGLQGAAECSPTSAYVSLINGKYKYLLGTQRDIFRLRTRGVTFKIKPIDVYNDLYQNISILTQNERYGLCEEFINGLMVSCGELEKIGMLADGKNIYEDEMRVMQNVSFEYTLKGFVGENFYKQLKNAEKSGDINLLKNLLK